MDLQLELVCQDGINILKIDFYLDELTQLLFKFAVYDIANGYWIVKDENLGIVKQIISEVKSVQDKDISEMQTKILSLEDRFGISSFFSSLPVPPYDYQRLGIQEIINKDFFLLGDDMGLGKQQPLDAKILTPNGWTIMGKIKIGDFIIGSDGKPILVTSIFPQGFKSVYKVSFSDGSTTECGPEHLWNVQNRHDGIHSKYSKWQIKSLLQIMSEPIKKTISNNYTYNIPIVKPIHYNNKNELPLHPYLLGFLLGNGTFAHNAVRISFPDKETLQNIKNFLPKYTTINKNDIFDYCISGPKLRRMNSNPVMKVLKNLGLRGLTGKDKFVPNEYLYSSIENRLFLLQGLMDSDGCCFENGNANFDNGSLHLIDAVVEIVRSLGGIALKTKGFYSRGPTNIYRISISLSGDMNPFLLSRKANRYRTENQRRRKLKRSIIKIEYIGEKLCQCISVDAKDGLYVTDDFIVTHNSYQALGSASYLIKNKGYKKILIFCQKKAIRQWINYSHKFCPDIDSVSIEGTPKIRKQLWESDHQVYITNLEKILWDLEYALKRNWDLIILDEASYFIKNPESKRAKKLVRLHSKQRLAMTGTPIENKLVDLYSIFNFLNPNIFGNYGMFERKYVTFIIKHIPIRRGKKVFYQEYKKIVGYKNVDELKGLIKPYYLRRTEKDVDIQLPQIVMENFFVPLLPEQREVYDKIVEEVKKSQLVNTEFNRVKLQRAYDHSAFVSDVDSSNKIETILELVEENQHRKTIIFSQWADMVVKIHEALAEIPHSVIVGSGSKDKFNFKIDDEVEFNKFQNENNILVATDAVSRSMDIPFANVVINVDLPWNPATLKQRIMRCRRLSSTHKTIFAFNIISEGTIEESVLRTLEAKMELMDMVFEQNEYEVKDEGYDLNNLLRDDVK